MPAKRTRGIGSRSPVLPASSDATLDFTTPQDTSATGQQTAIEPHPVMYITEEHIMFTELPHSRAQEDCAAADHLDAGSWQPSGSGRQAASAGGYGMDSSEWSAGASKRAEGRHGCGRVASVLSGLQQDSQAELEGALANAWDGDMDGPCREAEVEFVPETAAKCSPDRSAASAHRGISPAGRLGFQERDNAQASPAAEAALRTELGCAESLSGAGAQDAFLEGLRSPQLYAEVSNDSAAGPCRLAAEPGCSTGALGLACSPKVPAWGGAQQPVSLWAAYYEGPDILLEAEGAFLQPAALGEAAGSEDMHAEEDLLSPIHRHPLALDCAHGGGPAHKRGLSRRAAPAKRAQPELCSPRRKQRCSFPENSFSAGALQLHASPTVEEAVLLSGAAAGSPNARHAGSALKGCPTGQRSKQLSSPSGRHSAGDGGCSVLQELSNGAYQHDADLERLLTPLRGAPEALMRVV